MAEAQGNGSKAGKEDQKDLRARARSLKASVQLGKSGMSEQVLMEMKKQLAVRGLVKVKFLKPFLSQQNRKKAAEDLACRTGSELIAITGFTGVYHKEKKKPDASGKKKARQKKRKEHER